jgi:hypothetical protein
MGSAERVPHEPQHQTGLRDGSAPDNRLQWTALCAVAEPERVCQAWHRSSGVEVPAPGYRGAEG